MRTPTSQRLARSEELFKVAEWSEAFQLLQSAIAETDDDLDAARLRLVLVDGFNFEDWKRGLTHRTEKHDLLDHVDETLGNNGPGSLRAESLYQRGMCLHIEFVMAAPDFEREQACFAQAAELFRAEGDRASTSLATAMLGIFHHVDLLDRATAEPILWDAHAEGVAALEESPASSKAALGVSEAARHLGQIKQELGDPSGSLELLEQSLRLRRDSGWISLVPSGLHARASALLEAGDVEGAARDLTEARALAESMNATFTLAMIAKTEADLQFSLLAPGVWRRTHP